MNRYNGYYPGNMQQSGRQQNMSAQRNNMGMMNNSPPVQRPAQMQQPMTVCPANTPCSFEGMPLAMAYVNWQNWNRVYDIETGFCNGTIFPCLDLPFLAYKGARL